MQGSIKNHRRRIQATGLALAASLTLLAAAPLVAHAGPLLSGYGGPGQGSQLILGSTLIGGPGGGAAGTGTGGPSGQATARNGTAPASASSGAGAGARRAPAAKGAGADGVVSASYPALERTASTGTFGLSGADISYVLLGAGALALMGVLMRRMVRPRTAKGH